MLALMISDLQPMISETKQQSHGNWAPIVYKSIQHPMPHSAGAAAREHTHTHTHTRTQHHHLPTTKLNQHQLHHSYNPRSGSCRTPPPTHHQTKHHPPTTLRGLPSNEGSPSQLPPTLMSHH